MMVLFMKWAMDNHSSKSLFLLVFFLLNFDIFSFFFNEKIGAHNYVLIQRMNCEHNKLKVNKYF